MREGGQCTCFIGSFSSNPPNPYYVHLADEETELCEGSLLHKATAVSGSAGVRSGARCCG